MSPSVLVLVAGWGLTGRPLTDAPSWGCWGVLRTRWLGPRGQCGNRDRQTKSCLLQPGLGVPRWGPATVTGRAGGGADPGPIPFREGHPHGRVRRSRGTDSSRELQANTALAAGVRAFLEPTLTGLLQFENLELLKPKPRPEFHTFNKDLKNVSASGLAEAPSLGRRSDVHVRLRRGLWASTGLGGKGRSISFIVCNSEE